MIPKRLKIDGIQRRLNEVLAKPETKRRLKWGVIISAILGANLFGFIFLYLPNHSNAEITPADKGILTQAGATVNFDLKNEPTFHLDTKGKLDFSEPQKGVGELFVPRGKISTDLLQSSGTKLISKPEVATSDRQSEFDIRVPTDELKPGKYNLNVDIIAGGKTQTLTQDFTWGVLTINVRRSYEKSYSQTEIGMSVLDDNGRTQCDAKVELKVKNPNSKVQTFSTQDGTIKIDPNCVDRGVTNNPDYAAAYTTGEEGEYTMMMTATIANGTRSLTDTFEVKDDVSFDVERTEFPTRIYPLPLYPVKFTVAANQDYQGEVIETVPTIFDISAISDKGTIKTIDTNKQIIWNVDWQNGKTYELGYSIKFPDISPERYLLGPLKIGKFQESRQWQVASDAFACTLTVSAGGTTTWNTAAWASCGASGYPGKSNTADTAAITFSGTSGAARVLNISASLPYSIASITASQAGSKAASIQIGGAFTVNVTDSPGTVTINQPGGAAINLALNVNTGTLTTSGNLTLGGTTTTANYIASANVTTGLLDVGGSVVIAATASMPAANKVVTLTNNGTVRIRGAETQNCGTFSNSGTAGTFQFDSSFTFGTNTGTCTAVFTTMASETIKHGGNVSTVVSGPTLTYNATSLAEFTASASVTANVALTFGNIQIDSGVTITLATDMTVAGNWVNNTAGSGAGGLTGNYTVQFSGASKTIGGSANTPFYGLLIKTGASVQLDTNATVGAGNFIIGDGTGSTATSFTHNTGVDLTVSGTVTINQPSAGSAVYSWSINAGTAAASGTVTLAGTSNTAGYVNKIIITTGSLDMNAATSLSFGSLSTQANHEIDISGGAGNIYISGSITNFGSATTTPGTTSTWTFDGTAAGQTIPMSAGIGGNLWGQCSTQCYANLKIMNTNAAGATLGYTIMPGNLANNLTVGDGSAAVIFNNGDSNIVNNSTGTFEVKNNATFNMTGNTNPPSGFITYTYGASSNVKYLQNAGPITVTGATYGNLFIQPSANSITMDFEAAAFSIAGNLITGVNGVYTGAAISANSATSLAITGNITIGANSTFTAPPVGITFTVSGNWDNSSGTFTPNGGTVNFNKGSSTQTLNSGGTGAGKLFNALTHSGAGTLQLSSNSINIDGIFTNSAGTFDANNLNVNVADDFLGSGGTFTAKNGGGATTQTVTFDGTNEATVSGSTTFNHLTMNTTTDGAKTIKFTAGSTQTISGTWTLDGDAGKVLTIKSTSDTNAWYFVIPADINPSGDYIDVRDSQNISNAFRITPGTNCVNSGNNDPGWLFASNQNPNTPASLTQKTSPGGADISESAWTIDNTPNLGFTITDNDSDTVKYELQIDDASDFATPIIDYTHGSLEASGTTFAFTVGSYGAGSCSGTCPATLADSSDGYWWKVKAIDEHAASSSYLEFGVVGTMDLKVDATAPTGGSVTNDANTGSLTQLGATWNGFDSTVSGLLKYQYAVGTTAGGTDIKAWTDNVPPTGTSATATSLNLQTSVNYYFSVKAFDNAGNTGGAVTASAIKVLPTLSFTIGSATVTFNNLNAGNSWTDTKTGTIRTVTNAANGYSTRAYASGLLTSIVNPALSIPNYGSLYPNPTVWSGTGFGYTVSDPDIGGVDMWASSTKFCAFAQNPTGDIVADHETAVNGSTGNADDTYTITYKVVAPNAQTASTYQTIIYYISTANF